MPIPFSMEAASPPEPGAALPPRLSWKDCVLRARGPREKRGRERGRSPPLRSGLATFCNPALEVAREILQNALEAVEKTTRRQEGDFTVSTIRPFLPYPAEKGVTSYRAFLVVASTLPLFPVLMPAFLWASLPSAPRWKSGSMPWKAPLLLECPALPASGYPALISQV